MENPCLFLCLISFIKKCKQIIVLIGIAVILFNNFTQSNPFVWLDFHSRQHCSRLLLLLNTAPV